MTRPRLLASVPFVVGLSFGVAACIWRAEELLLNVDWRGLGFGCAVLALAVSLSSLLARRTESAALHRFLHRIGGAFFLGFGVPVALSALGERGFHADRFVWLVAGLAVFVGLGIAARLPRAQSSPRA